MERNEERKGSREERMVFKDRGFSLVSGERMKGRKKNWCRDSLSLFRDHRRVSTLTRVSNEGMTLEYECSSREIRGRKTEAKSLSLSLSDASSHTEWKSEREEDALETFVSVRCVIPLFVSLFRCPLRCQELDRAFHGSLSCDFLSSSLGILQLHLSLTACLWIPLVVYSSLLSIPPLLLPGCVSRVFAVFPRDVWFCPILLWRQTLDWESFPMFSLWPKSFYSILQVWCKVFFL